MNTLVIPAVSAPSSLEALLRRRPFPLLPVCGKELIAYQLDLASSIGVTRVIVLSDDRPERVREVVGDGQRWGLEVEVRAVTPGLTAAEQVQRAGLVDGELLLLAGDTIVPPLDEEGRRLPDRGWEDDSGWVLVKLDDDLRARLEGGEQLTAEAGSKQPMCWRLDSAAAFHQTHMDLLNDSRNVVVPGFEVAPGVIVARGSRFSMSSVAGGPVLTASEARVSHRASVGPSVVVGPRSLVDAEAVLRRTVVMPDTYVGRLLEADGVILDGQAIIRADDDSVAMIGDDLLLAELDRPAIGSRFAGWLNRGAGAALALIFSPVIALGWMAARRPRWRRRRVLSHRVRYSVNGGVERLTTDLAELDVEAPALRWSSRVVDVMRGRLALVGNPPLEETAAKNLDAALVDRWLDVPVGLFGLAQIEWLGRSGRMDADDVAAAAVVYAGSRTLAADIKYVLQGFFLLLAPHNWRARRLSAFPATSK
jgi:hypothetical protein